MAYQNTGYGTASNQCYASGSEPVSGYRTGGTYGETRAYSGKEEAYQYGQQGSSYGGNVRQDENSYSDNYNTPNRFSTPPKQQYNYDSGTNSSAGQYDNQYNKQHNDYNTPTTRREPFKTETPLYTQNYGIDYEQRYDPEYAYKYKEPAGYANQAEKHWDNGGGGFDGNEGYRDWGGTGDGYGGDQPWVQGRGQGRGNRGRGNFTVPRGRGHQAGEDGGRGQMNGFRGRGQQRGRGGRGGRGRGRGIDQLSNTDWRNMKKAVAPKQPTKVAVEGDQNFISYKNSLQEYCQKLHKRVPQYTVIKVDTGYSANVDVEGVVYSCQTAQREKKFAELGAAFEALKSFGMMRAGATYNAKGKKRTIAEIGPEPVVAPKPKVQKPVAVPGVTVPGSPAVSYKCKLNEMCQKKKCSPTYTCEKTVGGFVCTVVLDAQVYQSSIACGTKKLAEQNAAQVVLSQLNYNPVTNTIGDATPSNVTSAAVITPITTVSEPVAPPAPSLTSTPPKEQHTTPNTPPVQKSMKNIVQEYCQKNGMFIPTYTTVKEAGINISTITVNGREFVGTPHILKKTAEQNAAKKAIEELGLK